MERYRNRPFVLLGVNAEPSREDLKALQNKEHLPWRSFWDGKGDIATRWGVEAFPTLFLVDRNGVVRHEWHGRPDPDKLDKKIEELLREVEAPTS